MVWVIFETGESVLKLVLIMSTNVTELFVLCARDAEVSVCELSIVGVMVSVRLFKAVEELLDKVIVLNDKGILLDEFQEELPDLVGEVLPIAGKVIFVFKDMSFVVKDAVFFDKLAFVVGEVPVVCKEACLLLLMGLVMNLLNSVCELIGYFVVLFGTKVEGDVIFINRTVALCFITESAVLIN